VDSLVKEEIEISMNKNNSNRDSGLILSQVWSPLTNMPVNVKAGTSKEDI
jgi:hypothetical protein